MRTYLFFILAAISFTAFSCKNQDGDSQTKQSSVDIPRLLDRNPSLYNGREWGHVQNLYGKYSQKLSSGTDVQKTRLELAQLFVNEARISGEHGHYYPAALTVIEEIFQGDSPDKDLEFRTLATKAGVLLSLHRFQSALQTGRQALELNPYNARIYGVLVDALVELGQYVEAVEMADKMVSIRPDLRSYARVSYLREIHGDVKGAIEAMVMAVKAGYPGYEQTAWTRLTLGELYAQYGESKKAEMQYRIILNERPGYPFALAGLAQLEYEKSNLQEAKKLWKEASDLIPELSFYVSLAKLYEKTGKEEAFEDTVKEIFTMFADDEQSGHMMDLEYAKFYLDIRQDYDMALSHALKEYDLRPDNIDVNRVLAAIYYKKGDAQKANQHFEKAGRTNSQHPELLKLRKQLATL